MTGFWLKMIAMLTMLIDHSAAIFLSRNAEQYDLYMICRSIGRISFPIFCFLLVEGFFHTRDVKKYMFRLGIFALISDIPFDLAFNAKFIDIESQNVFFTLFIGLGVIYLLLQIESRLKGKPFVNMFLSTITVLIGCFLANFLKTDYQYMGILMIVAFYVFRYNKGLLTVALLIVNSIFGSLQLLAVFAIIPIVFYNGKRGPQTNKYVFYAFYPVHLFVLFLISWFIF